MKKCINRRCNAEIGDDFKFCPHCGKDQTEQPKKRRRAKGSGSIVKRENRKHPYAAFKWVNGCQWYVGSYETKADAERAILIYQPPENQHEFIFPDEIKPKTVEDIYNEWVTSKSFLKLAENSKSGYRAAWTKMRTIKDRAFQDIKTSDFQRIVDYYEAPHHEEGANGVLKYIDENGKTTLKITAKPKMCDGLKYSALHQFRCLASKLCKQAMKDDTISKNYGQLVELPAPEEVSATRFTDVQLEHIRKNVGLIPYCDYIYILCYLNFRISEFLELTPADYHTTVTDTGVKIPYLVGGKKTEAGKNRVIPIHPNVADLVAALVRKKNKTIFCKLDGTPMSKDYFNKYCFKPAMDALGLDGQDFTPHSCRRTFSTRMSAAKARPEDITALMGHVDFAVDKKHYINQEIKTLYAAVQLMA